MYSKQIAVQGLKISIELSYNGTYNVANKKQVLIKHLIILLRTKKIKGGENKRTRRIWRREKKKRRRKAKEERIEG